MSFKVAKIDIPIFSKWFKDILTETNKKDLLMNPIPFGCGLVKFTITRNKSGINIMNPIFTLSLELKSGENIPLLYARKRVMQKKATYLICQTKVFNQRDSEQCLGKLSSLGTKDKYTLYDNGENFKKLSSYSMSILRTEHGSFIYRYEPCNVGNIRKMMVLLPEIQPTNLSNPAQ